MPATRTFREAWLFWILALLVLGAGLGLRAPWPADEPRFALVAKHMVESGDWLFPHRGGELYPDKPPLFMWLQAAAYTVSGNWRGAFLLPPPLAAPAPLWLAVDLGQGQWTRAGRETHGRKRRLAVPAPRRRAVSRQAAVVHVAAGGRVHGLRQLAGRVPAALAAGGARHPVAGGRPGQADVDPPGRPVRWLRAAVRAAVHLPGQARPDRS